MPRYATPGVYFEGVDTASQTMPEIRTDIAGFVGITQMGPAHRATAVEPWQQFQSTFGIFLSNGYLANSAKAFFENAGPKKTRRGVAAPEYGPPTAPPGR